MQMGRAERDRTGRRRTPAVAVCLLALLPLAACSDSDSGAPRDVPLAETTTDIAKLLKRRATAILERRDEDFFRALGRGRFRAEQETYYDNLLQLPISSITYGVVSDSVTPADDDRAFWATIETRLQLDGFDAEPVRTLDRWRFSLGPHGRKLRLTSTTDPAWEADNPDRGAEPWDAGPILVEKRLDVLGIFDETTVAHADEVMKAVSDGQYDVSSVLPAARDGDADLGTVVYALTDPTVIEGLAGVSVGAERADGLTIAIPADVADLDDGIAAFRMALGPQVLDQPVDVLDRLVRHELTHVLLRDRGRSAPLWITEGTAEWASVRQVRSGERRLPSAALTVGAAATRLPTGDDFSGPDAEGWYGVSWWVCEYIANTYGEDMLWALMDRLNSGDAQVEVLSDLLGLTEGQLVQRGVALMMASYR